MDKTTKLFIGISILLITIDLYLKSYITSNFNFGQRSQIIDGILTLVHAKTSGNPFSFSSISSVIKMIIFILLILTLYRFRTKGIHKGFKYSSILIIAGFLGNIFDKILMGKWSSNYLHTDYIWFEPTRYVVNLSSLMYSLGWALLIIMILVIVIRRPKELLSAMKKTT